MGGFARARGISDWSGRFNDPDLEDHFRSHVRRRTARQAITSSLVAAAVFAAFGLSDYALLGQVPALFALLTVRAVVVATCLLAVIGLHNRPELVDRDWPINILIAVGATAIILIVPLRPETLDTQAPAVMVAVLAIYLFMPNRIPWMVLQSGYLSVGFLAAASIFGALPSGTLITHALLLAFVNTVGLITAMRLARLRREQFEGLLEERETNDRLHSEIAARQHLERRLTELARTDDLTGLNNRRRLLELAEQSLRLTRREGLPMSVCIVDLDHFKAVNDRLGHGSGDIALATVAQCCLDALRESDIIGRFGGEEFVIVLPRSGLDEAAETAERLRRRVAALPLPQLVAELTVTVTVGVAEVLPTEHTIEGAMDRADEALYRGKRTGRNRVVRATPAATTTE